MITNSIIWLVDVNYLFEFVEFAQVNLVISITLQCSFPVRSHMWTGIKVLFIHSIQGIYFHFSGFFLSFMFFLFIGLIIESSLFPKTNFRMFYWFSFCFSSGPFSATITADNLQNELRGIRREDGELLFGEVMIEREGDCNGYTYYFKFTDRPGQQPIITVSLW